jgi:hypothetical protein
MLPFPTGLMKSREQGRKNLTYPIRSPKSPKEVLSQLSSGMVAHPMNPLPSYNLKDLPVTWYLLTFPHTYFHYIPSRDGQYSDTHCI